VNANDLSRLLFGFVVSICRHDHDVLILCVRIGFMESLPLLMLSALICLWPSTVAKEAYAPPDVTSAGDAYVPYQIVTDGLFVLDVGLSDQGEIQRIEALRDPGSMLDAAKTSVRAWKFLPASEGGKPRASRLTVAFLYRPTSYNGIRPVPPKDFVPVIPPDQSDNGSGDVPVGVLWFEYPDYPVNSVAWGSVVIKVTVDNVGDVKDVNLLHGMAVFNDFALDALKKWRFRPATVSGKPVTSTIIVAFVFQSTRSASYR
jgi:TonB family protein